MVDWSRLEEINPLLVLYKTNLQFAQKSVDLVNFRVFFFKICTCFKFYSHQFMHFPILICICLLSYIKST